MLVVIVGFDALRPDKIRERQESTLIQFRRAGWSGLPRQLTASKIDSFVRLRVVFMCLFESEI